jgi:hypothetical protein
MSIIPYNNFTVRDLSNVQQPYVNSCTEYGYFSGGNLGTIPKDKWYSLPASLNTNNGIATRDANGGLRILNSGIYSINLSLFPTATQDGSSNILFNFGTRYVVNDPSTNLVNAFGGVCPTGMFTYDPSNNPYIPGIISWVADGYNSGNNTISNFVKPVLTNELSYNYNNAGYPNGGALYSGISTTETTFVLDSSASIYFNVSTNSSTGVTMGNCSFTLKLISTPFTVPIKTWRWTVRDASNGLPATASWRGMTSSSSGQYLAACADGGYVWMSSNYGATWSTKSNASGAASWDYIASSGDGSILTVCGWMGVVKISRDYGASWTSISGNGTTTGLPTSGIGWIGLYITPSGQFLTAGAYNGGFYLSSNYGVSWAKVTTPTEGTGYASISSNGQYLVAGTDGNDYSYSSTNFGTSWAASSIATRNWRNFAESMDGKYVVSTGSSVVYTSSNYGVTMTPGITLAGTTNFSASSLNGQYLAVSTSNYIYTSSNYGAAWFQQTSGIPSSANWSSLASSSDGSRLAAVVQGGTIYIGVLS